MSNSTLPAEPRRGARARKQVDRFAPQNGKTRHDGDDSDLSELTESEDERPQPRKRKANGGTRAPRPPKRPKAPKTVPASDVEPIEGLKNDSSLFNALLQPDVALEPLVDDWVHAYQGATEDAAAEKSAIHELVIFLIRACGLSANVDEDEAVDLDGTGEAIDRIQEESVKNNTATYPLIAKVKQLRAFKPNLSSVVQHLIESLKLSGLIYEDNESTKHSQAVMPLLLAWLGSMSSSPLRSIRHTSTFIGLKVHSALCDAAAQVNKDLSVKQRQKEAEAKKSGPAAKKRAKNAEDKVKESHAQKVRLEEHMKEIFDVIFIHRLRDTDPAIRTACVHELGVWVKKYPEKYATNTYLNYFVRGSNDPDGGARLETVKALTGLFSNVSLANNASSFTLRLAPRLIKMASLDVETPVRTNAINVITLIDKTGALQDEMEDDREKVARLIFDKEPRVRKAAAGFVQNLWDERAEHLQAEWKSLRAGKKKRAANVKEDELDERLRWKTLAALLVQTAHGLTDQPDEDSPSQADFTSVPDTDAITRAEAAADGLWPQLSDQQEELADYLLLDHSTHEQDMWLLTEEEEDFMLGMLIACIKKEDEEDDEKTKSLMGILPRLFTKHQSEPSRIAGILSIPEHMNLQLYLDMRKTPAYEALWTDVTNQFLKHTDGNVLQAAIRAINKLVENSTLDSTNTSKLAELEEAVFASLRDAINGEDVFSMQLDDDAAILVEAILLRVSLLGRSRDITSAMMDEEGGQSSGWAIVSEFAKRGGLGFKQETKLVASAIKILLIQVGWLIRRFSAEDAEDEDKVTTLRERQQEAFEIFEKYGIGGGRATESVRREAFQAFIYLHTLFAPRAALMGHTAAKACPLEMTSDRQHKLGGAFQATVERYASDLEEDEDEDEDDLSFTAAQRDIFFLELVAAFVSALCIGVIDVEQAKEPLTHYGRFGATYDQLVKRLVDVLRDEGIYNGEATTVQHVVSEALQNSFSIFLDSHDDAEPEATMALARLGAQAFIVPGLHFTVVKQIHPDDVYDLHVQNLDWVFKKVTTLNKQLAASKDSKARLIKQRARVLMYLKPLALLLGPVTGRDALRIRDHLEKLIDDCGDPTNVRSTAMYRGYEKRLVTIAGKDTGLKVATKKAASKPSSKSREVVEDSDEERNEPETANGRHKDSDDVHEQEEQEEAEAPEEEADPEELEENEENGDDEREEVDPDADADAAMDVDEDEDMEATPTKASQVEDRTPKRRRDHSSLPDLELDPGVIHADEIDLAFTDLPDERERSRSRSLSVEPTAKRRKTTKRY